MNIDVLVTDCDTKHGFAISRYLREKGLKVFSHYRNNKNPYYFSIHSKNKIIFDLNKEYQRDNFIKQINELKPIVTIPVSNLAVKVFSDNRNILDKATIMLLPEKNNLDIAQNKFKTFKFAEKIGVRCPKTIYETSDEKKLLNELNGVTYPLVLKYVNFDEKGVVYCNSEQEVLSLVRNYNKPNFTPPILQEYISGTGLGFYAIYKNGKVINYFMHKRLHEYPVTGGASSFAMSFYNEELKVTSLKILDSLQWNGVAMIEFKLTDDNQLYLIEINPKFWGSYELSEKCGISFAYDYYLTALGEKVEVKDFKINIGFRWIFSEVMYFRDRFLNKNHKRPEFKPKIRKVYNDLYFDEPFIMIAKFFDMLIRLILKKRNPHSIPLKNYYSNK